VGDTLVQLGAHAEHDAHVTYQASNSLSLRLGVINITNAHPPLVPELGTAPATATTTSVYDNRGRWLFAGGTYTLQ
jgi:outer membrane receptor protein involved in Fe transport